jgi:hypothetical protein
MSIQEFPLAWRWTQASYAVLPPEVLAQIRPLSASEATQLCSRGSSERTSVVSCSTEDPDGVSAWLRRVQPDSRVRVYVAWSDELAVETNWQIFTEYWDDFCYPSSDDVKVAPVVGTWQLVYHHYEQLDFSTAS